MNKAKHMWVLEMSKQSEYGKSNQFYTREEGYSRPLQMAFLFATRSHARELAWKGERVRKVLLNKAGKPYKVIRRKATV